MTDLPKVDARTDSESAPRAVSRRARTIGTAIRRSQLDYRKPGNPLGPVESA